MGEVMDRERYVCGCGSGSVVKEGAGKDVGKVSCQDGVGESIDSGERGGA